MKTKHKCFIPIQKDLGNLCLLCCYIKDLNKKQTPKVWSLGSNEDVTSSEDSISDSSLDISADWGFAVTGGGGGRGGGGAGTSGGNGGVGSAIRNGAGMFILFIKCRTYIRELKSIWLVQYKMSTRKMIYMLEKESNKSLKPHLILEQPECKSEEQQLEHSQCWSVYFHRVGDKHTWKTSLIRL